MSVADHFVHPEAAPLLLLAPLAWFFWKWLDRRRARRLEAVAGPRLAALAPERDASAPAARRWLVSGGLLFALLALLEPRFGAAGETPAPRGADVVLVLDVSRSMLARDVEPTRLRAAQQQIEALSRQVAGDRLALVAFAGKARRLVPLTSDLESFRALADAAGPESVDVGGSDLEAALDAALGSLAPTGQGEPGLRPEAGAIVLLSDGEAQSGAALAAAERCRARGVVVDALGFGSRDGSKVALVEGAREEFLRDRAGHDVVCALDATALATIADRTGGSFVDATSLPHALSDLYREKIAPRARAARAKGERDGRANRFQWPLLVALLLFVAANRWSEVKSR